MADHERRSPRYGRFVGAPLSIPGLSLGIVLLWFSMGSSLLPRSAMMQGVVSALSFTFGYAVATLVSLVIRWTLQRFSIDIDRDVGRDLMRWILLGVAGVVSIVMAFLWPKWQSAQGELVGVDAIGILDGLKAIAWTIALTALLMLIGRSIRWMVSKVDVSLEKRMRVGIARGATAAIVAVVFGVIYAFIVSGGLAGFANARFAGGDETTLEGVEQPMHPEVSGSPDSLVEWDDLGYQGRTFTGAAPTVGELSEYDGSTDPVSVPIRVYAGLKSAESPTERAKLVVDELIRTNAKDRAVLALVTTTGTGWVDPKAAAALEYMWRGDTVIAAMQYSFLPSWISFILDTATAMESGVAINEAVITWWEELPEDDRPRLIAFGESLGSLGSESGYARGSLEGSLEFISSKVDGVLWVGPTDANPVRRQLLAGRDPSPVWLPVYDDGAVVRFANAVGYFDPTDTTWESPRIAYYHHPSDPVGYWNWETLWKSQEWMEAPVGDDVPDSVRWIPFTTFTQVVVDLINGFSASVGHGHNYNDTFVEGWSIVAPVEGWTAVDTERLEQYLDSIEILGL